VLLHNGTMPRRATFLLAPLLAFALLACGGGSDTKPAATNAPGSADLLTKAGAATKAAKSFHFNFTQDANATMPMPLSFRLVSAEGDYAAPDRIKAGVKAKAASANVSVDVIGVGDRTWITNPFTRKWQSLPDTTVSDIADPSAIVGALLTGLKDPKVVGEQDIDGVKTYRVSGTIDSATLRSAFSTVEAGFTNNVELWLGANDSLPRRARITGQLYKDDPSNVTRQVDLTKFGAAVDIKAPE
jgi:lipoprotein LprG